MIHIIEMTELVTTLSNLSGKKNFSIKLSELREIGYKIERENKSLRVNLSDSSRQMFIRRNRDNITFVDETIIINNTSHPTYKHLVKVYSPSNNVSRTIEIVLSKKSE